MTELQPWCDRLDGPMKVTGAAQYVGDLDFPGALHGAFVLSTVAAARAAIIDTSRAERIPGVACMVTHANAPRVLAGPYRTWLQDAAVHHAGQPMALVLAEAEHIARRATQLVSVEYQMAAPRPRLGDSQREDFPAPSVLGEPSASQRGDPGVGRAAASVAIHATYTTPAHSHSPIESPVVLASWEGDRVTVYTSTSGIFAARRVIAQAMSVPEDHVRVLMRFQGGGFGAKGAAWWPSLILAVSLARFTGQPVRLTLTRAEMFSLLGRRAPTEQRIALGATRDGCLTLIEHHAIQETSPLADYSDATCLATRSVYACPNVVTDHRLVRSNTPQPNAMRAPGETPGSFVLESALDELACRLSLDPIALRLRNIAKRDEHRNRDWSSNGLAACLTEGARAFGWQPRPPGSAATRIGATAIGQGVASAYYPTFQLRAAAQLRIDGDGHVTLWCGNQDIGNGGATVMVQAAARVMGIPASEMSVEYGDTALPEAPTAAGSWGTASVVPAVEHAARALCDLVIRSAVVAPHSPLNGAVPDAVRWESPLLIVAADGRTTSVMELSTRLGVPEWEAEGVANPSDAPRFSSSAFGACFAEVHVDVDLGQVQVARLVGAFAAGRIINTKLARSQLTGGMIFGIGMALHERIEETADTILPINRSLTGYHLPVNADVPMVDVRLIDEMDANPASLGIKGVGMIGAVGVSAAIANAVFDATGRRIRDLPITAARLIV